jgi:hypothetical protein
MLNDIVPALVNVVKELPDSREMPSPPKDAEIVPLLMKDCEREFVLFWTALAAPLTITPELTTTLPAESRTKLSQSAAIIALAPPVTGEQVTAFALIGKNTEKPEMKTSE